MSVHVSIDCIALGVMLPLGAYTLAVSGHPFLALAVAVVASEAIDEAIVGLLGRR